MSKGMAVIGLTGGIASGKSTVAARMRERGVAVIDADQLAREVVAPGQPALALIEASFGAEMIQADGTLDRQRLGALVFSDPRSLDRLNQITHPAIMKLTGQRLLELRAEGHPWVAYEAALIIENGLAPGLSELVVVVCEPATQVRRIMSRNGLPESEARQRVAAQTTNAVRRAQADRIIDNEGSLEALLEATDALIDALNDSYGDATRG